MLRKLRALGRARFGPSGRIYRLRACAAQATGAGEPGAGARRL